MGDGNDASKPKRIVVSIFSAKFYFEPRIARIRSPHKTPENNSNVGAELWRPFVHFVGKTFRRFPVQFTRRGGPRRVSGTQGRECGVGRGLGVTRGGGVGEPGVTVGVGVGGIVPDGVGVGLGGTVAVAVAVGVGVGEPPPTAARISTRPQP
jgi:hypothetical protein